MRLSWIDNMKGLLLVLVVLQHTSLNDGWGAEYYGVFHMAAFFFLSGVLYNPEKWGGKLGFI